MLKVKNKFFNIHDTLLCGQVFRYFLRNNYYVVISGDKVCKLYYKDDCVIIESDYDDYFYKYFDLERDYEKITNFAKEQNIPFLTQAVNFGSGIRILKQDKLETIFSFVISQNNNIPRIKFTIEKLCQMAGKKIHAFGEDFYAFPTLDNLKALTGDDYRNLGLGYRADYFVSLCEVLDNDFVDKISQLDTQKLRGELLKLKGIGPKVCDCILLFGFSRTDTFPVDTWIEKIYHQDFCGQLSDNKKISQYFVDMFGLYSGFIQQYLFYYKRENNI